MNIGDSLMMAAPWRFRRSNSGNPVTHFHERDVTSAFASCPYAKTLIWTEISPEEARMGANGSPNWKKAIYNVRKDLESVKRATLSSNRDPELEPDFQAKFLRRSILYNIKLN
jgi:hypothetical protein